MQRRAEISNAPIKYEFLLFRRSIGCSSRNHLHVIRIRLARGEIMTARSIKRQRAGEALVLLFREELEMRPARAALLNRGAASRADQRRLRVPFRDKPLRELYRDIDRLLLYRIEVDHRCLHPLSRNHSALSKERWPLLTRARVCPIINEFWQPRRLQRPPIQQHSISSLDSSQRTPFIGDVACRR